MRLNSYFPISMYVEVGYHASRSVLGQTAEGGIQFLALLDIVRK
jgi:hypothetical protein